MAMPRSACASAGASLMPSPTMATRLPPACSFFTAATFSPGITPASTLSMPASRATASAAARWSPVIIQTSSPICRKRFTASAASGLMVSAISISPAVTPSTVTVAPGLATTTTRPPTRARTPRPVRAENSPASSNAMPRSPAASTMARPRGCSE